MDMNDELMGKGGEKVEILIDADVYYRLKKYADEIGKPMSMVATNAIKNYLKNRE